MSEDVRSGPVIEVQPALGRREVLQALMAGAGATVAVPALAHDHPVSASLQDAAKVSTADQKARAGAYQPQFLDRHGFDTLVVLAEQIVPGSTQARVAPFLDALLAVEPTQTQRRFVQAMGGMERLAIGEHRKPWKALTAAEQTALLTKASTAQAGEPARDHFEHLKGWISGAYYSSEAGMKELGWTGRVLFDKLPECGTSASAG